MKQSIIVGIVTALAFLITSFSATNSASAKSVTCDEAGNCVVRCSQTLGNGSFIEYDEGTEITVTDSEGVARKFKCVNGEWVHQARTVPGAGKFGNISVATIGGVMGELSTETCNDSPEPVCTTIKYQLGPRGLLKKIPECDPNSVACP